MTNYNVDMYFGTISRSMFTLFNMVLMVEYPEFMRPVFFQDKFIWFVLTVFSFFTVFGVLNVLVAVIVDNMMQATSDMKKEDELNAEEAKIVSLLSIRRLFHTLDADGNGMVTAEELEKALKSE